MGGASTEIDAGTTDVLVEMAWWDPPSISRTAKRLNLASEASTRFRRGADWGYNVERCMNRFAQLAAQQGAEVAPGVIDERGNLPDRPPAAGADREGQQPARHRSEPGRDGRSFALHRLRCGPRRRRPTGCDHPDVALGHRPRPISPRKWPGSTGTRTSSAPCPLPTRPVGCRPTRRTAAWRATCWWVRAAMRPSRCPSWRPARWLRWACPRTASPCPTRSTTASRC